MKVLKKGFENASFGKDVVCSGSGMGKGKGGCGAVLHVVPADIHEATYSDYGGGSDTSYWFVCPECGASTYVRYNLFSRNS